jgi:hypothetical protein
VAVGSRFYEKRSGDCCFFLLLFGKWGRVTIDSPDGDDSPDGEMFVFVKMPKVKQNLALGIDSVLC